MKAELPKRGYQLLTTRWNHVRISPSVFNDMDDVERVIGALPKL